MNDSRDRPTLLQMSPVIHAYKLSHTPITVCKRFPITVPVFQSPSAGRITDEVTPGAATESQSHSWCECSHFSCDACGASFTRIRTYACVFMLVFVLCWSSLVPSPCNYTERTDGGQRRVPTVNFPCFYFDRTAGDVAGRGWWHSAKGMTLSQGVGEAQLLPSEIPALDWWRSPFHVRILILNNEESKIHLEPLQGFFFVRCWQITAPVISFGRLHILKPGRSETCLTNQPKEYLHRLLF